MRVHIVAHGLFLALVSSVCFCQQPQQVGTAYFSNPINWSQTPDLYFTILGGQPNTCGELVTFRNGSWLYAPGWACVDGNGNANMGAWTWANTPGDQTDTNVQIIWPNGNYTNATSDHIWDKSCPSIQIDPSITTPPTSLSGSASDNQYGAGFDDGWTAVKATFWDETMDRFWNPATGAYDSVSVILVSANVSTMPSHNIAWSFPLIPRSHTSGHRYSWVVDLYDGDNRCSGGASQAALFDYP
jgi:hypothetical protein